MLRALLAIFAATHSASAVRELQLASQGASQLSSNEAFCRKTVGQVTVYVNSWGRQQSAKVRAVSTWPGCVYTVELCDGSTRQAEYQSGCGKDRKRSCISDGDAEGYPVDELPKEDGGVIYKDAKGLEWVATIERAGVFPHCEYRVSSCGGEEVTASFGCSGGGRCLKPFDASQVPKMPLFKPGDHVEMESGDQKSIGIVTGRHDICGLLIQTCTSLISLGSWALSEQPEVDLGDSSSTCCLPVGRRVTDVCPPVENWPGHPRVPDPRDIQTMYEEQEDGNTHSGPFVVGRKVPYCKATITNLAVADQVPFPASTCDYTVQFNDGYQSKGQAVSDKYDSASARNNAYLRRLEKQEIFKGPCDREAEKRRFYAFRCSGHLHWDIPGGRVYDDFDTEEERKLWGPVEVP